MRLPAGPLTTDPEIERAEAVLAARMLGQEPEPTRIGRYIMLERVGQGAMGVVYAAHDDQLDRKLAIKLLHRELDIERVWRRLKREAQTMARLNHEHVAKVYEVGQHRERSFVAMEYIDGATLREWQRAHTAAEILACYVQAGRGLAAAHAAGIVHRDFKPDNVLVGADPRGRRRVCVVDFGLALIDAMPTEPTGDLDEGRALANTLSRTGAIAGTPAYMAPEQFRGDGVGPAADQFAFCVALFEALAGQRPFAGDTPLALYESVVAQRIVKIHDRTKLAPHIFRALARGMSPEPTARWRDMNELMHAIARDPSRWRRRSVYVLVAVVALAAIAGVRLEQHLAREQALAECEQIEGVWTDAARERVRAGVVATQTSYATATAERVLPALDAYAQAWTDASAEACRAALVQAAPSDASAWCLDERGVALEATIDQLARADTETVARAVTAVAALPRIETCLSADLLARFPVPPTTHREQVSVVRAAIVRADAIGRAGRHDEALASAEANVVDARALDWPPLLAAAHNGLGQALHAAARYPEAEAELSAAYFDALLADAFEVAVAASTTLVHTVGVRQGRHADGLAWSRHAETALARLHDPSGLATARLLERVAQLRIELFEIDDALEIAERALAIREAALGPDHPDVGDTVFLLASARRQYERNRGGLNDLARRAVEIAESSLGPDHPDLVPRLDLLAEIDPPDNAPLPLLDRALAIGERSLGPDDPVVAKALVSKGRVLFWQRGPSEAKPLLQRALAIQEATLGSEHQDVAVTLNLLGMMEHPSPEAVGFYQRAIVITENEYGPKHPFVAPPLYNLAEIAAIAGDYERAAALQARATEVRRKVFGAVDGFYKGYAGRLAQLELAAAHYDRARELLEQAAASGEEMLANGHCDVSTPILLGELALREGRPPQARAAIDRALDLASRCTDGAKHYANAAHFGDWVLARALWDLPLHAGRDRDRAVALARDALDTWRALPTGPRFEQWVEPCPLWCTTREGEIAKIEEWLDART